jgi:hypothetical protein
MACHPGSSRGSPGGFFWRLRQAVYSSDVGILLRFGVCHVHLGILVSRHLGIVSTKESGAKTATTT